MYIFKTEIFGITIAPSYYGLMYAIGFLTAYIIIKKGLKISTKKMDDLLIYSFLGVLLGGRIAYILFYDLTYYLNNPGSLIKVWEGGMSFHGGVIGVILAMYFFSKKYKVGFLKLADYLCYALPIGLFFGRIGNYLNKELLGFSNYNGPFAIYINSVGYFPSPLLEAFLEGIVLFGILHYAKKIKENNNKIFSFKLHKKWYNVFIPKYDGQIAALFLIFYSIFRIIVEIFFRVPDTQIGYIFGFLTMGEILTFPMLISGIYYFIKLSK
ncbi:prolipoprotein diacylglyceryl transferase [Candidatus Gracilibacteria bacterium]|nr:prolipoprotein diacylglyceryl transferase [Candidatus Gracilibacteria bacterium]